MLFADFAGSAVLEVPTHAFWCLAALMWRAYAEMATSPNSSGCQAVADGLLFPSVKEAASEQHLELSPAACQDPAAENKDGIAVWHQGLLTLPLCKSIPATLGGP